MYNQQKSEVEFSKLRYTASYLHSNRKRIVQLYTSSLQSLEQETELCTTRFEKAEGKGLVQGKHAIVPRHESREKKVTSLYVMEGPNAR
jgi:hypothetical protein